MSGSGSSMWLNRGRNQFYYPLPPMQRHNDLLMQQQQQMSYANWGNSSWPRMAPFPIMPPPPVWYPVVPPPPPPRVTNLDRFINAVTPSVEAQFPHEENITNWRDGEEHNLRPFYGLGDLWDSFEEWSAYGVGVPLVLKGNKSVVQYYIPYLSGLQLYVDPAKSSPSCRVGKESSELSFGETSSSHSLGTLIYEYMETDLPYKRKPLSDHISDLTSGYPDLRHFRSSDLLPSSWLSIAWYPIYRIPIGPTLKDMRACFLTFHNLSTSSRDNIQLRSHGVDEVLKIRLPVFALAHYRLQGSILSPCGPHECEQETSLLKAADNWLRYLNANLPDYDYFVRNYSKWR